MTYNLAMRNRSGFRFAVLAAGFCLFLSCLLHAQDHRRGRKYKAPPPSATVTVTVFKADNGKPIRNASVIFHPIVNNQDQGGMELKTDGDGKATIDVIPVGDTVLLQVISPGFQTYGETYKIDKPTMSMEVHLRRPVTAYSIYKNNDSSKSKDGNSGAKK